MLIGYSGIGKRVLAFQLAGDYLDSDKLKPKRWANYANTANEYQDSDLFHPDCNFVCPEENKTTISIDRIRSLKSFLELTSHQGKGKVGIIHPAESMTYSAANSLLKVLEEPPDETLLILITESIQKLPETVISRMQIHNIRKPSVEETVGWLNNEDTEKDWQEIIALFGSRPLLINELGYEFLTAIIKKISTDLDSLVLKKSKPSEIAANWAKEDLDMLLKILYIRISSLVTGSLVKEIDEVKYVPSSFKGLIGAKLNYELCFNYLNEIANIRHHLLNGKGLNWSLQISNLLTPIYADLKGLIQHG
jgi:DNA polymerase-3 subunit delta'